MSPRRHFNFSARAGTPDHQHIHGFQVLIGEALTFDVLQHLFEDLYLQWRYEPKYLFIAEADTETLKAEMYKTFEKAMQSTNFYGRMRTEANYGLSLVGVDTPYRPPISRIINFVNGRYVHVVSLPDLAQGSVMLGFFQ